MPGLEVMGLHEFGTENVALVKWAPNTRFTAHRHRGGRAPMNLVELGQGVFAWTHESPSYGNSNVGLVIDADGLTVIDTTATPDRGAAVRTAIENLTAELELPIGSCCGPKGVTQDGEQASFGILVADPLTIEIQHARVRGVDLS